MPEAKGYQPGFRPVDRVSEGLLSQDSSVSNQDQDTDTESSGTNVPGPKKKKRPPQSADKLICAALLSATIDTQEILTYTQDETKTVYHVGDTVYVQCKKGDNPYTVCTIQGFQQSTRGGVQVHVKYYFRATEVPDSVYLPLMADRNHEIKPGLLLAIRDPIIKTRELFRSEVTDTYSVNALKGKCRVVHCEDIHKVQDFRPLPDTYFYIFEYNPNNKRLATIQGEIRVGPSHQARLPDYQGDGSVVVEKEHEDLTWLPTSVLDGDLLMYLRAARSMAAFAGMCDGGSTEDAFTAASMDETTIKALDVLHQCGYCTKTALEELVKKINPKSYERRWSEEDVKRFVKGLRCYGKNFFKIRKELLPNKDTAELVEYYYFWKKTPAATNSRPHARRRRPRKQANQTSRQSTEEGIDRKVPAAIYIGLTSASEISDGEEDSNCSDGSSTPDLTGYYCRNCNTSKSKDWHHGGSNNELLCTKCRVHYEKYNEDRPAGADKCTPPYLFKPVKCCYDDQQDSADSADKTPDDEDSESSQSGSEPSYQGEVKTRANEGSVSPSDSCISDSSSVFNDEENGNEGDVETNQDDGSSSDSDSQVDDLSSQPSPVQAAYLKDIPRPIPKPATPTDLPPVPCDAPVKAEPRDDYPYPGLAPPLWPPDAAPRLSVLAPNPLHLPHPPPLVPTPVSLATVQMDLERAGLATKSLVNTVKEEAEDPPPERPRSRSPIKSEPESDPELDLGPEPEPRQVHEKKFTFEHSLFVKVWDRGWNSCARCDLQFRPHPDRPVVRKETKKPSVIASTTTATASTREMDRKEEDSKRSLRTPPENRSADAYVISGSSLISPMGPPPFPVPMMGPHPAGMGVPHPTGLGGPHPGGLGGPHQGGGRMSPYNRPPFAAGFPTDPTPALTQLSAYAKHNLIQDQARCSMYGSAPMQLDPYFRMAYQQPHPRERLEMELEREKRERDERERAIRERELRDLELREKMKHEMEMKGQSMMLHGHLDAYNMDLMKKYGVPGPSMPGVYPPPPMSLSENFLRERLAFAADQGAFQERMALEQQQRMHQERMYGAEQLLRLPGGPPGSGGGLLSSSAGLGGGSLPPLHSLPPGHPLLEAARQPEMYRELLSRQYGQELLAAQQMQAMQEALIHRHLMERGGPPPH